MIIIIMIIIMILLLLLIIIIIKAASSNDRVLAPLCMSGCTAVEGFYCGYVVVFRV